MKDLSKKLLYASGLLGLYHRLRNAGSLTVVMFHRTLSPQDPRWRTCDPDYTLSVAHLSESLAFFKRHYNVVSLQQVVEARRSGAALPPHALLITFDDGWSDNADYALPELQRAGLPGLMFVVADAVGTQQPFFQERLISAWRRGLLRVDELALAMAPVLAEPWTPEDESIASLRRAIARLEKLDAARRSEILAPYLQALDDGLRHMVDASELHRLQAGGIALGLHGKTHTPMTAAADLDAELAGAREELARHLGQSAPTAESMSFPHGAHTPEIAERARQAGYELVFTSVPVLNSVAPQPSWLLGRTGYETDAVVDTKGRFRPDWLALYLFRRETRRLA
ncbi:polysaccharide deacetylase family protein [Pseudoxanthomonas sacheonensis]|uniref:Peptidoglycan/xylan/chitin deacetylase (PgdA/CDA1 family) n=1 Tax=Pseudoxanthomonas sacheonensis TaxID=443615 RepID=A0ABU1RNE8_9GAMM|nr:polysaccharide deacetylase family protein [Pseudoxanthomonas sacheonensis]MDR6840303.1 peptidoglycan/xylan/chitin deacetylase (PgdA/CDA1 family) [Pseudoxanthomonas sacheonensis]